MSVARSTRLSGRVLVLGTVAACGTVSAQTTDSHTESVSLTPVVVSASRTPQEPRYVSSAVQALDLSELSLAQVPSLADALKSVPGVFLNPTGAVGGQASVFIRGAASHQTLFVVDGVRMNDRSAPYFNTLGGATLGGIDRLEVLRGPQSTLYGSNAVGGVILLDTTRGCGKLTGKVAALTGDSGTIGGGVSAAGGTQKVGYSVSLDRFETDNERPFNEFKQTSGSARLEATPATWLLVGATARVAESWNQEPGSTVWPSQGIVQHTNHLATAYASVSAGDWLTSRVTLGQHARHYRYATDYSVSDMRNRRRILDWQTTANATDDLEIVAGTNFETSRYTISGSTLSDRVQAGYLSSTYKPTKQIALTAGVRYDDYGTFSSATTGRGGVSFLITPETKLRATYGTGFIAPGTDDRFGVPAWGQLANPNLVAEKSRGWDAGVDHTFKQLPLTVSATYFENRIRNLFTWETVNWTTYEGMIVNKARAETRGVELGSSFKLAKQWTVQASYTYLHAEDALSGVRLTRRPRHIADASVAYSPLEAVTVGVGAHLVADRIEGSSRLPSIATWRAFASYEFLKNLKVQARVENALDRVYEDVVGYPALPRQVFAGVEWTF